MTARFIPLDEVLPALLLDVDFVLADVDGELCIDFRACPCCGKRRRAKKAALMTFDHPALKGPVKYLLDVQCGRRMNGHHATSTDAAQAVAKNLLGAVLALTRVAGRPVPLGIQIDNTASLAMGSGGVQ